MARKKRQKAHEVASVRYPYTPERPPPGSYDIGLDAQERAAQRGFGYLTEDLSRAGGRATDDYLLGVGDVGRQRGELNEDLARQRERFSQDLLGERQGVQRGYNRSLSDLITQRTQGQEDYQSSLQNIARNFQRLGNQQSQRGRQMGLQGGGFAAQAARKRSLNEGLERQPVTTNFNRFMEASKLGEGRLNEDRDLNLATLTRQEARFGEDVDRSEKRGGEALDRASGELGLGYRRGIEDRGVQFTRGGQELQNYLQDIAKARQAQYGKPLKTVYLPRGKKRSS